MDIKRNGTMPSTRGPESYFTGDARVDGPFQGIEPGRVVGATVTFEPGARTAWHTHPLGQNIVIISGFGLVQREGGPVEEVHAGDIVWFPADEKHWHGASPTTAMSHVAVTENLEGKATDWLEKVTDEQYLAR